MLSIIGDWSGSDGFFLLFIYFWDLKKDLKNYFQRQGKLYLLRFLIMKLDLVGTGDQSLIQLVGHSLAAFKVFEKRRRN